MATTTSGSSTTVKTTTTSSTKAPTTSTEWWKPESTSPSSSTVWWVPETTTTEDPSVKPPWWKPSWWDPSTTTTMRPQTSRPPTTRPTTKSPLTTTEAEEAQEAPGGEETLDEPCQTGNYRPVATNCNAYYRFVSKTNRHNRVTLDNHIYSVVNDYFNFQGASWVNIDSRTVQVVCTGMYKVVHAIGRVKPNAPQVSD